MKPDVNPAEAVLPAHAIVIGNEQQAAQVVKTVLDRSQMKDAATAVGTSMVLARTIDDMLVILNDALKNPQKPYMRHAIEQTIKAGMAQDRTYAIRLRRTADSNGTTKDLLPAQPHVSPEIVTLCGSTRFLKEFNKLNFELSAQGKVVLSVAFDSERDPKSHKDKPINPTPEQKVALDELHKRKIDISDSILVINPKLKAKAKYGYIGQSTAQEIVYAHMAKKQVAALEDLPPMEEIIQIAGLTLVEKKEAV